MRAFLWLFHTLIDGYIMLLIASIVLQWLIVFNIINTRSPIVSQIGDFLHKITEPALSRIRRYVPLIGGIDLSPMVLILALYFVKILVTDLVL